MLVTNPRKQKLSIQVKDNLGFADTTVGTGEVTSFIALFWHKSCALSME